MASDNPIFNIIDKVLGIQGPISSFEDKITRLRNHVANNPLLKESIISDVVSKALFSERPISEGYFRQASSETIKRRDHLAQSFDISNLNWRSLNNKFKSFDFYGYKQTGLPSTFLHLGSSLNNPSFISNGIHSFIQHGADSENIIPILGKVGSLYTYNQKFMAMYSSLTPHGIISPVDEFSTNIGTARSIRRKMYAKSPFFKGVMREEVGEYVSNQLILPKDHYGYMYANLNTYKTSLGNMNQIMSSSGRYIPTSMYQRGVRPSASAAFDLVITTRQKYIESLQNNLAGINDFNSSLGSLSSYMFTKPEFLSGDRSKILVSNAPYFNQIYGTRFEEGPATKGLFQVANMAKTTSNQLASMLSNRINPYAAYTVGSTTIDQNINLRVGVIDFMDEFAERTILSDGGSILTHKGASKLAGISAFGSVNIKRVSADTVKTIQSVFGVNLGGSQLHGLSGKFNPEQKEAIELLSKSSKEMRGLLPLIEREGAVLDRVTFTDSGMQLAFRQGFDKTPDAAELVIGTRRTTATRYFGTLAKDGGALGTVVNRLNSKVDVFMSASEFYKMHGPQVFVNNFISAIQKEDNAEEIFKTVFGNDLKVNKVYVNPKKPVVIPHITSLDSAFDSAMNWLQSGPAGSATDQKLRLMHAINHGLSVSSEEMGLSSEFTSLGIKGIRTFNVGGANRLDFGGDINIMKPLRYTASQIQTMASANRMYGYSNAYQNPVIRALTGRTTNSKQWTYAPAKGDRPFAIGKASIGINPYTNQIDVGSKHAMRLFARAALGEYAPDSKYTIGITDISDPNFGTAKAFTYRDKLLRKTPMTLGQGGLPKASLKDTILGIDRDIVFLDMGKAIKYNDKEVRYLPIPLKYLALKERDGAVVANKGESLDLLLGVLDKATTGGDLTDSATAYMNRLGMELGGKAGRFNRYSTILTHSGSRVRLAPSASGYHSGQNFLDPNKLFNIVMSRDQFSDLLTAKSGLMQKNQLEFFRERLAAGDKQFYGLLSVDPMQRAEHSQVVRVILDDNLRRRGFFGHMVVEAHSMLLKMMERDVDRDAAKLMLLNQTLDRQGKLIGNQEFEAQIQKQAALSRNYLLFERYNLQSNKYIKDGEYVSSASRFKDMVFSKLENAISTFIPIPKSLGYTIARGPSELMQVLVEGGVLSGRQAGIISGSVTEDIATAAIKPFLGEAGKTRFSFGMQYLQSILQAPVQKATSKTSILLAGKELLAVADKYKAGLFNQENIVDEVEKIIYNHIVEPQKSKQRMFQGINFLLENEQLMTRYGVDKETTQLVLKDLEQGSYEALSDASRKRIGKVWEALQRGQSRVMAEILGPGLVLGASLPRTVRSIAAAARGKVTEETMESKVLSPFGGGGNFIDDITEKIAKAEAASNFSKTAKSFLSGNRGAIGLGFLGGAIAGFGVANMLHDDLPNAPTEAPLPRDIDTRRPTDSGPVIQQPRPRVYGTNQIFTSSSNKRNQNFNQVGSYSTRDKSTTNITISDKTAPNNPYLLEMHLKSLSRSDYTY